MFIYTFQSLTLLPPPLSGGKIQKQLNTIWLITQHPSRPQSGTVLVWKVTRFFCLHFFVVKLCICWEFWWNETGWNLFPTSLNLHNFPSYKLSAKTELISSIMVSIMFRLKMEMEILEVLVIVSSFITEIVNNCNFQTPINTNWSHNLHVWSLIFDCLYKF